MTIRNVRTRTIAILAAAALLVITPAVVATASTSSTNVRLVVAFRAGTLRSRVAMVEGRTGVSQVGIIPDLNARVITVPASEAASTTAELRGQSSVAYVQPDSTLSQMASPITPNDPYFAGGISGQEWGEVVDGASQAWSTSTGSSAVTLAVIDSGVVATQPDLAPNLVPGWNVVTNSSDTSDSDGHGTEVAGVAAAATNNDQGVAGYCWSCRIMPVEVFTNPSEIYSSNIASGITWAVDHGANVINISLGGTTDSAVEDSAVAYALAHNVVVVAAAGNYGTSAPVYPAAIPGVISVGASDQTDTLETYSSYGSWVDVAAPGSQATTLPTGGYGGVGGTSVASPAVAGIVGLMLSTDPGLTPAQVDNALLSTTTAVHGANQVAYGVVNAAAALGALGATPTSAPSNTVLPSISGTPQVDQLLTASTGTWTGTPTSDAYQWFSCETSGCSAISGATSSSYQVGSAEVGASLEVEVTATNVVGSTSAMSLGTGEATPAPTTTTTTPPTSTTTTTVATTTTTTPTPPTSTTTTTVATTTTTTPTTSTTTTTVATTTTTTPTRRRKTGK